MTTISIRGTSGSGKSYLVREVMGRFETRVPFVTEGSARKRPMGYILSRCASPPVPSPDLIVLGSYENDCGGLDTFKSVQYAVEVATEQLRTFQPRGLLMEGLLASEDVRWCLTLRPLPHIIQLSTPVEECLASIRVRRLRQEEAGRSLRPFKEDNTRRRVATIDRACARLKAAGLTVERLDRTVALNRVLDLLGLQDGW